MSLANMHETTYNKSVTEGGMFFLEPKMLRDDESGTSRLVTCRTQA
jgi:hypothetical protein